MLQCFVNYLIYRRFLEEIDFEKEQKSVHTNRHVHLLLHNRHQEVGADGDPDLGLDRVLRGAEKRLDAEVALDPFEEQLHLPAAAIDVGHRLGGDKKVVGYEDEPLVEFGVEVTHPPKMLGILFFGFASGQHDDLVALDTGGFVHRHRTNSSELKAPFRPNDKVSRDEMEVIEPREVEVSPVHDLEGIARGWHLVHDFDIVGLALCNHDEYWDRTSEVEQGVELDGGLCFSEVGPREQREAQIDGG